LKEKSSKGAWEENKLEVIQWLLQKAKLMRDRLFSVFTYPLDFRFFHGVTPSM
jgi:hypothetical protein